MVWMLPYLFVMSSIGPMGPDAPAREPQLAVNGPTVAMVFGAGQSIYFSRSTDSGKTFADPVKVGGGAVIPLTRHRGPRIAFAGSAIVITAVVGKTAAGGPHAHGLPSDGDLIAWRSTDGGQRWSSGIAVNDVPASATEGLHALASEGSGHLFAAWLDKRDHGTQMYGSRSDDGGRSWSKNTLVYNSPDGTICECCHPSLAFDKRGKILVMWRNWLNGSRDMYLAQSTDGTKFSAPRKLGDGTWRLNACPMDGGGLAVSKDRVFTAWRREHDVYLDEPGQKEVAVGQGTDIALTAGDRGVYLIWSSQNGVELLSPGHAKPSTIAPQGSFPAIAAVPDGHAVAAWENAGKIEVQVVR